MRVFVIGATGVLGRNVIPRLLERGHEVRAVVRQPEQAERLQRLGVRAALGDILDADSLTAPLIGCDAVLHLATAIPRSQRPEDWLRNDEIRRDGTRNLLAAARRAGAGRYVQQSITFLYGDRGMRLADEDTPLQPAGRTQSAADMEELVRGAGLEWSILRGGALYGPHTGAEQGWREGILDRSLRLPGEGTGLVSLIHEVDFARALVLAAEAAPPCSVFNVVDDEPVTYRQLYGHVAALLNADVPEAGGPEIRSLGCSNARLKEHLGWTPAFPSYRSGIVA
ncbi:MAG TPA: NAD(P)-dependent oxidoreductase [Armatimonadota bacterium]|nr:NAD(P)-dependent oxidoreductase [Armatimonadota bacterium]